MYFTDQALRQTALLVSAHGVDQVGGEDPAEVVDSDALSVKSTC